jgi:hypothetical protein
MRAQKDTQEAFMRYTSYREIEQQARLAVTNAEKRRDDFSKQWRPYSRRPSLISYSGYHSSPKSDANGFVNVVFLFGIDLEHNSLRCQIKKVIDIRRRSTQSSKVSYGGTLSELFLEWEPRSHIFFFC